MSSRKPIMRIDFGEEGIQILQEGMRFDRFGDKEIFRPRVAVERTVLSEEEDVFRESISPGKYRSAHEINRAIHSLCKFYGDKLY